MRSVCVFCGSNAGARDAYVEAARRAARTIAEHGLTLVYGGAAVGLMGAVADAALAAGGTVIGVIPQALVEREIAHKGLTELLEVTSMHERKALMADRSDAFLALPGGPGRWRKPSRPDWGQPAITRTGRSFNVEVFFDRALRVLRPSMPGAVHAARATRHAGSWRAIPSDCFAVLPAYRAPVVEKWIRSVSARRSSDHPCVRAWHWLTVSCPAESCGMQRENPDQDQENQHESI